MPRFLTNRDRAFIKGINRELIDDVIETSIIIYKRNINDNTNDIYGESIHTFYNVGVQLNCLIDRSDQSMNISDIGMQHQQSIKFLILRSTLETKNVYPFMGDIINWNDRYYEISNDIENQYIAGRSDYNYSIILEAFLTNKKYINME